MTDTAPGTFADFMRAKQLARMKFRSSGKKYSMEGRIT